MSLKLFKANSRVTTAQGASGIFCGAIIKKRRKKNVVIMSLKYNTLKMREVDRSTAEKIKELYKGLSMRDGFVVFGPKKYFFSKSPFLQEHMESIYTMPIRKSDLFITTFPRSGTTLTQELVWLVANNLDYDTANSQHLLERYTTLGSYFVNPKQEASQIEECKNSIHFNKLKRAVVLATEVLTESSDPRFIKTHIPLSMLPPDALSIAKFVYVARDPRDVAVSYYHLHRLLKAYEFIGEFKAFWHLFINDLVIRAPYFEHVKEAWEVRDHPNMLFIFYEDILNDTPGTIRKISGFLGKQYTDEQILRLTEHLKFENFKRNPSANVDFLQEIGAFVMDEEPFVRKGKAGGWRDYFDEEMSKQAELWIKKNLRDTDLKFLNVSNS